MSVSTLDFIVEEPSMEAFLRALLPPLLQQIHFNIYPFQGKDQLLERLPSRLQGYAKWVSHEHKIVVLVDRDDDDCVRLKTQLEQMAERAGLFTRSRPHEGHFTVVNRIAIEELEAWYFGDWEAVRAVYPRLSATIPDKAAYRNVDAIAGGTCERFERVLQQAGYFKGGLRKIEAAHAIAPHIVPHRNCSRSFQTFLETIIHLVEE